MDDKTPNSAPLTAEEHGRALSNTIVRSFMNALKKQAGRSGGYLSKLDVESLIKAYEGQIPRVGKKIAGSISAFAETSIRDMWDPSRTGAFERVLVKNFSHLLKDDATAARDRNFMPRRALPGIFMCVRMMAGPEQVEVYEQDAFLVMQRVRDDEQDRFSWDTVYADKRMIHMVQDLLIGIAPYFANLHKRIEWMLPIINSHLAPVDDTSPLAEWQMNEVVLVRLIDGLYSGLWELLGDDLERLRMTKKYGARTVDMLSELMTTLAAETQS